MIIQRDKSQSNQKAVQDPRMEMKFDYNKIQSYL